MNSKHTKAGRHARRRAHHVEIARVAMAAHGARRFAAWLRMNEAPHLDGCKCARCGGAT